jgi:hypothetical protein
MSHFSEARKIARMLPDQLAQAVSEGILRYLQQIYRGNLNVHPNPKPVLRTTPLLPQKARTAL